MLLQPAWVDRAPFDGFRIIEVDPAEEHAANVVRLGDQVVMPACFPRTRQRLLDAGIAVTTVDVSELQKAEGAVTCCSLLLADREVARSAGRIGGRWRGALSSVRSSRIGVRQ